MASLERLCAFICLNTKIAEVYRLETLPVSLGLLSVECRQLFAHAVIQLFLVLISL